MSVRTRCQWRVAVRAPRLDFTCPKRRVWFVFAFFGKSFETSVGSSPSPTGRLFISVIGRLFISVRSLPIFQFCVAQIVCYHDCLLAIAIITFYGRSLVPFCVSTGSRSA